MANYSKEKTLEILEVAAIAGMRCPTNDQLPRDGGCVPILAREGFIKVELYSHNFRRVTIMQGTHRGKTTKNPPLGVHPYKVIECGSPLIGYKLGRQQRTPVQRLNHPWSCGKCGYQHPATQLVCDKK